MTAGTCTIAANTAANGNYTAATATQNITVTPATQSISFGAAPSLTYGGTTGSVSATASSGLPVTFSSQTPTVCTINGATVTPLTAGTCSIAATAAANGNYTAAGPVTQNITVAQAIPGITWANPAAINYGTALSITQLNATSGIPGTFAYTPPIGTIMPPGAGQTLFATFTPNDTVNYNSLVATTTITVITNGPVISDFTVPATSATLALSGITITATDNVGVTGYFVSESATAPLATDPAWTVAAPTTYTCTLWGNCTLYAYAKDAAGNISAPQSATVLIGAADGVIIQAAAGTPQKLVPQISDALMSLYFAMKVATPTEAQFLQGKVAPLVNGVPDPDPTRTVLNLGDTIVILRRVVGLSQ